MAPYPADRLGGERAAIRLLVLLPGDGLATITCTLREVTFENMESYEALSYEWGDAGSPQTILVNDKDFDVGQNLYQALRHLRLPDAERILWIDAICVNQTDLQERNHQVQQMADVYSRAHQVVAWIGLETEDSKVAFEFLRESFEFSPRNRKSLMEDPRWQSLEKLCQRPYWGRVWIVQEICLAQRLIVKCGESHIPWRYISELRTARKHIWPQYLSKDERTFIQSVPACIDQQRETRRREGCVLWTLLELFRKSHCKEVHDKVYGFIGMSNDCGAQGISVDYSKSVSQVYEDVMRFYQTRFCTSDREDPGPDGAQLMKLSEFLIGLLRCPSLNNEIASQALLLETPLSPMLKISATQMVVITAFIGEVEIENMRHPASELVEFLRGTIPYSHLKRYRNHISPDVREVYAISGSPSTLLTAKSYLGEETTRDNHQIREKLVFVGRCKSRFDPYITGVAPEGTQVGDIVCTFLESRVALVFRPTSVVNHPAAAVGESIFRRNFGLTLVGSTIADLNWQDEKPVSRARLNPDKTIEIFHPENGTRITNTALLWPATLLIDISTLQLVTRGIASHSSHGFAKTMLNLLPRDDAQFTFLPTELGEVASATSDSRTSEKLHQKKVLGLAWKSAQRSDEELKKLQHDHHLREHALGPGYAGIWNLGATGYVSSTLQILYMLKPIRTGILSDGNLRSNPLAFGGALRDLFLHLQRSSLPVSPSALTYAMGWNEDYLHQTQDVVEFFRMFTVRVCLKNEGDALYDAYMNLLVGRMESITHGIVSRVEEFFDLEILTKTFTSLEDSLRGYQREENESGIKFRSIPPVFIISLKNKFYNTETGSMEMVHTQLTYPRVLNLTSVINDDVENSPSDLIYQLHGVVVLEDVKPVPRFLLYLRPRQENQWLLFFNEDVTYGLESEVFEHNFRLNDGTVPAGAPLRIPILLLYLRVSMLDILLG
ncbi:heterokaryon incompatibility protein-domain-containing protein [Podospora didyma]|uniref:Heterokaryon incompatibility protein-domain-containing protein n=1 Tax=Podospora didyma TaxID=330526 RepID=A0AAE0NQ18_9PEZI|nr:heterokaryon incompatibility protein-domain-containing protein [Podospora didyma]